MNGDCIAALDIRSGRRYAVGKGQRTKPLPPENMIRCSAPCAEFTQIEGYTQNITTKTTISNLTSELKKTFARQTDLTALQTKVNGLVAAGGEPNVLETVKVNGTALTITDKAVDVPVPGYTIEKAANSGDYAAIYQLMKDGTATGAAINIPKDMVVQSGSVVTLDASGATAAGLSNAGTYIKLVLSNATNDTLYIDVSGLIEYVTSGSAAGDMVVITIDETTHKVTASITDGTITKAKLASEVQTVLNDVANKVDKETGKGLSANDYTDEEKAKLAGIAAGATKVEASATNGNIKINGTETTVYTLPETVIQDSDISDYTAEEIAALLADETA